MSMREKLDALAEKIAEYASADCRFAVSEARVKYWHDELRSILAQPDDTVPRAEYERVRKLADDLDSENQAKFLSLRFHCERAERAEAERERLREALRGMLAITRDSGGIAGYHLNGDVASWDEFPEVEEANAALTKPEGRGRE